MLIGKMELNKSYHGGESCADLSRFLQQPEDYFQGSCLT